MTTEDIFRLADECIEVGFFPSLAGRDYVLGMEVPGTGRGIVHRRQDSFSLACPCRVWLLSGATRLLLGDSHALPAGVDLEVSPPYTG